MQLNIENVAIDKLTAYPRNARAHSRQQIRKIARSIERFGFLNPILVGDNHDVIAGHGRLAAAKLLQIGTVPTVKISHLSSAEKRAYILADNKLALDAGWDREMLAIELQELVEIGIEIDLTGFETAEIDGIICEFEETQRETSSPDDQLPATRSVAVSCVGDCWELGKHRLLCGDSRSAATYETLLEDQKADLVFTDPPYNVPIRGHVSGLGETTHREFAMASGEMDEVEFANFLRAVLGHAAAASRDGALQMIFMDWRHAGELIAIGREIYGELINLIVWSKTNGGMGSLYRSQHELLPIFKVGSAPHTNNVQLGRFGRNRTNVWTYPGVNTFRTDRMDELAMHPTVKPVALVADAIKDVTHRNNIVLDPFCGSGTTVIAAEKTGRRAFGIEIDPLYVDIAIRRWEAFTGKQAKLRATDKTYEEVCETRAAITVPNFHALDTNISPAKVEVCS